MIRVLPVVLCNFPLVSTVASGVSRKLAVLWRCQSCRHCSCNQPPEDQYRQAVHIWFFRRDVPLSCCNGRQQLAKETLPCCLRPPFLSYCTGVGCRGRHTTLAYNLRNAASRRIKASTNAVGEINGLMGHFKGWRYWLARPASKHPRLVCFFHPLSAFLLRARQQRSHNPEPTIHIPPVRRIAWNDVSFPPHRVSLAGLVTLQTCTFSSRKNGLSSKQSSATNDIGVT